MNVFYKFPLTYNQCKSKQNFIDYHNVIHF